MIEFFGIIALLVGVNIIWRLFFAGARVAAPGVKSAATGQSFNEALGKIPPLETRIVDKNTEEDGSGLDYFGV